MKNQKNNLNASTMADVAFLLLIFFLVTTTIDQDKGLLNKLPAYVPDLITQPAIERNVLEIHANGNNQLMVEGKSLEIAQLKAVAKTHILNNGVLENFSLNPEVAIISLQNDRQTSYDLYLSIQNELKAAYNEVRNEEAMILSSNKYNYLELKTCIDLKTEDFQNCVDLKEKIKSKYPMKISEAEPVAIK